MAGWQPGREGFPFPPIPACLPALWPHATHSRSALTSWLFGDLHGLTPARDQRDKAISGRAATSGGESQARRPPVRKSRAGEDPAAPGQRQRSDTPTATAAPDRSPRLNHLWRLETEFENPPISGGRRGASGQSRGGTARAHRPLGVLALLAARFARSRPIVAA